MAIYFIYEVIHTIWSTVLSLVLEERSHSSATEHAGTKCPHHTGPAPARHARDTGEVVFTPVAQLVQTSVFNQWARSRCGPALVTSSVAVFCILSPHHDCGYTEVAPDPEIARVQEEVCSAEERCWRWCGWRQMSSSPHLLTLLVTCYTAPLTWHNYL